ncbi:MAG: hypothetical protein E6704_06840 [Anaerococcus prevotii]|nr:hypothetical protein [Anaerococcus prevotii]
MKSKDMFLDSRVVKRNVMDNNITEEVYRHKDFDRDYIKNNESKNIRREKFFTIMSIVGTILMFLFKILFAVAKIALGIVIFVIKFILGVVAIITFA